MKRVLFIFFCGIICMGVLQYTPTVDADSTVIIHNNVQSSSSSTSTSNCHTSVHMETNGKVQEYESDNCTDVHMQSGDVSPTSTQVGKPQSTSPTTSPTITSTPTPMISNTPMHHQKVLHQQQKSFFQRILDIIKNFFK